MTKQEINTLYQRALTGDQAAIRRLSRENLTSRQKARLSEVFRFAREAGGATPRNPEMVRTNSRGQAANTSLHTVRNHPVYRQLWRHLPHVEGLPVPDAYYSGSQQQHRVINVSGSSSNGSITILPGQKWAIFQTPWDRIQPWYATKTLELGNAQLRDVQDYLLDFYPIAADLVAGSWTHFSPEAPLMDPNTISGPIANGDVANWTGAPGHRPTECQVRRAQLIVRLAVPYDGQAVAYALDEGTNPSVVGRNGPFHPFDPTQLSPAVGRGQDPYLSGGVYLSRANGGAVASYDTIVRASGTPYLITGATKNSDSTIIVNAMPETFWALPAHFSAAVAPAASSTNANYNFRPRYNSLFNTQYGTVYIENTGMANITVMVSNTTTMTFILPDDNPFNAIPAAMVALRANADVLRLSQHQVRGDLSVHHGFGSSIRDAYNTITQKLGFGETAPPVSNAPHIHPPGSTSEAALAVAGAAGIARSAPTTWARITRWLGRTFQAARNDASAVATRIEPVVEEAGEGALMLI